MGNREQKQAGKEGSDLALPPETDPSGHNPTCRCWGCSHGTQRVGMSQHPIRTGQGRAVTYFRQNPAAEAAPITNLPISDSKNPCRPNYKEKKKKSCKSYTGICSRTKAPCLSEGHTRIRSHLEGKVIFHAYENFHRVELFHQTSKGKKYIN